LSILSLKIYHTDEQIHRLDVDPSHIAKNHDRKRILLEQRGDLAECLLRAWTQACAGQVRFKLYRQLKMYNDPTLNPELYQRTTGTV
jgi:hypothetical protein